MDTHTTTPTTIHHYRRADQPLRAVLDAVPAEGWDAPSPCEGWTTRDVVRHLIDTQRDLLAGHDAEVGDAPDVDAGPADAWRAHADRVLELLADDRLPSTRFEGYFGPTTVGETLERFYVFDMVAHRWDIARAAGAGEAFTEAELDQLEGGMEGFGPALYAEGICRPAVEVPADADRQTRVLARLGRAA